MAINQYNVTLNFSRKEGGVYVKPNLEKITIEPALKTIVLTKRVLLSKINSIYDPLGLITPLTINAVSVEKNMEKKIDWDEELDQADEKVIREFFISLFDLADVKFQRWVRPENAISTPTLIIFSDASLEALGACSYLRWEVGGGLYESFLVASKIS